MKKKLSKIIQENKYFNKELVFENSNNRKCRQFICFIMVEIYF